MANKAMVIKSNKPSKPHTKQSSTRTRRPIQKGKIKKALNPRIYPDFEMRSKPPADMKVNEPKPEWYGQKEVADTALARNVANWRAYRGLKL